MALCGRDNECHRLLQAYNRSKQCNPTSIQCQELVLIEGHSGTGKTRLANSIRSVVTSDDSGFFLAGKFELSDVRNPYEVFVSAFGEFPAMIQSSPLHCTGDGNKNNDNVDMRNKKIRQAIQDAVGTEGQLLTNMIPALKDCIEQNDEDCQVQSMEALHRFQFVFSKFVRALSSVAPLVLFLDDLQWSDPASLSLLQAVLESPSEPDQQSSLLVICAYRDCATDENTQQEQTILEPSIWSDWSSFLEHVSSSTMIHVNKITLQNLDEAATSQLVAEYLGTTPGVAAKLGASVFAQSGGNPFHALQLLGPLMSRGTLNNKDGEAGHGILGIEIILEIAEVTQTVDEYLRQRLSLLPPLAQQALQVAACIGGCIDHPALCTVLEGNVSGVEHSLETALKEGFLIFELKLGQYRFSHDRVRQAVLSMIDDVNTTSFQIGYDLWKKSSPLFLNTKMFMVANLLNHGTKFLKDQSERYKAADINLEAGMKAISLAAFQDAARYLRSGIEFLDSGVVVGGGDDHWKDRYDLSLSLFNNAADAELCNQNFDRVAVLVEEVFQKARSFKDKLCAFVVQINSLGQRGNVEAATQVGIEVMRQLGEPLPRKVTNMTILVEIMKTRVALRGRSDTALLTLPHMHDENAIACMYVLTNLVPYTFQASSNYIAVIGARLVRLCLQHGMHKWSASGFSVFGFVLCTLDRKEGYRLGKLALKIIDRYCGRELLPRVHMNFYGLVHHWMYPLEESLEPLVYASKVGMEVGDVEYAMISLCSHANYCLYQGKPLAQVDAYCNEAIRRMRLLREDGLVVLLGISHQYVRLLTGQVPLTQLGEVWPAASKEVDSLLIPYSYYFLSAELAYLFGRLDLASEMLEKNRSLQFEPLASYLYVKMRFMEALICASLVRTGMPRKQQNLSIVKASFKQLCAWSKDCPHNYKHKQKLVEAELMSLSIAPSRCYAKHKRRVLELFDVAVIGATKGGFLHEAALAKELAGDFLSRQLDSALAHQYWDEAHALYLQWGATEKAKHLLERTSRT